MRGFWCNGEILLVWWGMLCCVGGVMTKNQNTMQEVEKSHDWQFKAGQRFKVHNGLNAEGQPALEGFATLVKVVGSEAVASYGNYWLVVFDDDPGECYPRFVCPTAIQG
jgi:hypothetical protein